MTTQSLTEHIRNKASFLCVGLDSELSKLPPAVRNHSEAQFEFNKAIIEATHDLAVAYKINTAFYESDGSKGYQALEKTIKFKKTKENLRNSRKPDKPKNMLKTRKTRKTKKTIENSRNARKPDKPTNIIKSRKTRKTKKTREKPEKIKETR